ncbi:MAG: response regulator transcription factor [Chlorobium sp.]|jgi:DNA-binding CsgD family transcriptional regulator|nr:response regulator transcription factor [Chlorobium sp.]
MQAILTPTEDLICRLKVLGLQRKEIADRLHRSQNTIIVHVKHIHSKLKVNNEVETVVWYIENILHIDIKKFIQISVLLAILTPSIFFDNGNYQRAFRSSRTTKTVRASRSRRNESETEYTLQ